MGVDATRTVLVACATCGRRNRVPVAAPGRPRCAACSADLPWLVDAGDQDFDQVVRRSALPVLVDVWAAWCGPCRTIAPVVERLAQERAGRLKVAKVDADRAPRTTSDLQVQGIPTLVLFVDGQERGRLVGAQPPAALHGWLDRHLEA
jgi:thioredoxin 2